MQLVVRSILPAIRVIGASDILKRFCIAALIEFLSVARIPMNVGRQSAAELSFSLKVSSTLNDRFSIRHVRVDNLVRTSRVIVRGTRRLFCIDNVPGSDRSDKIILALVLTSNSYQYMFPNMRCSN